MAPQIETNVKQGALIGGWVCFAVGMFFLVVSGCGLVIAVPLLIAAFMLSIVSMSQRRVAGGVALLLTSIIIPPVAFMARMAISLPTSSPLVSPTPMSSMPPSTPAVSASPAEPSAAPTAVSLDSLINRANELMKAKGKLMWLASADELKKIRTDLINVPSTSRRYSEIQDVLRKVDAYLAAAEKEEKNAAKRAASKWSYTEQSDEMGRGVSKFATVESDNSLSFAFPYSGEQRASLRLQTSPKYGKGVILAVERGQFICSSFNGCKVSVRFDGGQIQSFSGAEAANFKTNVLFIQPYEKFLNQLRRSKKVDIEAEFFQDGARVMTFSVDGLEW